MFNFVFSELLLNNNQFLSGSRFKKHIFCSFFFYETTKARDDDALLCDMVQCRKYWILAKYVDFECAFHFDSANLNWILFIFYKQCSTELSPTRLYKYWARPILFSQRNHRIMSQNLSNAAA